MTPTTTNYGRFCEILSKNWGIIFDCSGCTSSSFVKFLAFAIHKPVDELLCFESLKIEEKLLMQELNFKLEFWDNNSQKHP